MPAADKKSAARMTTEQAVGRLVDATIKLLADKGPSEIKARSVADAAQVSTIAMYHHLGGLRELLQAVVDKGFHELETRFEGVPPSDDPVADLFAIALTCRKLAQDNPHLYDLMFGLSTRGTYRPSRDSTSESTRRSDGFQAAYSHLVRGCGRLLESGRIRRDGEPEIVAAQLWSCVHGFVTLELGGHFSHIPDPVRQVLQAMTVNILVGLGDTAERANRSHDRAIAGCLFGL
jgi:AcrR family transcriptional regulator